MARKVDESGRRNWNPRRGGVVLHPRIGGGKTFSPWKYYSPCRSGHTTVELGVDKVPKPAKGVAEGDDRMRDAICDSSDKE